MLRSKINFNFFFCFFSGKLIQSIGYKNLKENPLDCEFLSTKSLDLIRRHLYRHKMPFELVSFIFCAIKEALFEIGKSDRSGKRLQKIANFGIDNLQQGKKIDETHTEEDERKVANCVKEVLQRLNNAANFSNSLNTSLIDYFSDFFQPSEIKCQSRKYSVTNDFYEVDYNQLQPWYVAWMGRVDFFKLVYTIAILIGCNEENLIPTIDEIIEEFDQIRIENFEKLSKRKLKSVVQFKNEFLKK